jgi:amino acid adenylation domain-containing protein
MRHTLVELLQRRSQGESRVEAFTFLAGDAEAPEIKVDYAALDRTARAIAVRLHAAGAVGQRALLLYPPGLEYVAAFFGCLYAGVTAVPVYPPDLGRLERSLQRLRAIVRDAQARFVLTTSALMGFADALVQQAPEFEGLDWLATDDIPGEEAEAWVAPHLSADSVAFLQYTSGSTSNPKGVVLTHGNLLHNLSAIQHQFRLSRESRGVIWLPPYHDMGLIGGVLAPIFVGLPVTLMSPLTFLQDPFRWLKVISERRGTCSGGPNFAYELCVRKITEAQKAELDLSSWELAFCGAEPVRPETVEAFAEAFAPCGFQREAFYPCYGLAESTLIVTGAIKGQGARFGRFHERELEEHRAVSAAPSSAGAEPQGTRWLVGCGLAVPEQQVLIVDPRARTALPEGHVGEIWVCGPSVAQGYWNRLEETERTFRARLAGQEERGEWLRTGDLGFLLEGQLFVTGRLKDLLIIRGRNYYPQDIEFTVEQSHPALRPGCTAVFSVPVGASEEVVVVQEVDRRYQGGDWAEVLAAIRRAVSEQHELRVHAVALIKAGTIQKTSSGKIQRSACRDAFLNGQLDLVGADVHQAVAGVPLLSRSELLSRPGGERLPAIGTYLAGTIACSGGLPGSSISGDARLTALGLDSLALVELKHQIERDLGVLLDLRLLLGDPSLDELAARILLEVEQGAQPLPPPQPEEGGQERLALTHGQRALRFLHQLEPGSPAYTIARAARIRGPLDVAALRRALEGLVARHPVLRTSFPLVGEDPVQHIHEQLPLALAVEDAAGFSEAELQRRLIAVAYQPFDLERGPLLRVTLFSRAADEHVLLLAMHHIIADFWSLAVLVDELRQLYEAADSGEPGAGGGSALPPPGQPAACLRWQSQYLASSAHEEDWAYWRQQLSGPLPRLELPRAPAAAKGDPAPEPCHRFKLGRELRQRAEKFSRLHGVTLNVTLLTAFQALLHRLTGQEDIIVGTPVATRSWPGSARLVGYCVNTLPLRVELARDPSFPELVARTGAIVRGALEHQEFPFSMLVERLQPERIVDRTPIFQALFVYQRAHLGELQDLAAFAVGGGAARMRLGQASVESIPLPPGTAQFELTLAIAPDQEGLLCAFEYDRARLDAGMAERLAAQYECLLAAALETEHTPLSLLPLLPREQLEQHLLGWNATARSYRSDLCLHELVAAQAAKTPEAVAVVSGAERLTYAELQARASRLAALLRRHGVGPEVRVGVLVHRTAELLVGLLAILEAGGAYVPLDPRYPRQRLDFILRDAKVAVLLTQRDLASLLPEHSADPLYLDELDPSAPREGAVTAGVRPDNLAYVLYTSGSTGQPKGVAISHRSAVNFVQWATEVFAPEEMLGVLASTSICFDLSVFELFAPLSCGGRVILADTALHLPELPAASEVTLINTVPSAISELLMARAIPASVRTINLAGEPLSSSLVSRLYEETSAESIVNLYGPSETTTYSTYTVLPPVPTEPVSIGRAIANTQVYVLDANLQPVPEGVKGELFIGGIGVARGYLARPRLTAERFLPDPFSGLPGARLYRTGDLVRHCSDGTLEFLGRVDHQVKVRGFRIELGEIEALLRNHPAVKEAAVLAWGTAAERQLVAYVVPAPDELPSSGVGEHGAQSAAAAQQESGYMKQLREFLRGRLPDYMVPSQFVLLEALPLTPNGKINRAALPEPRSSQPDSSLEYLAPRNELEARIAAVWAELLRRERVGVHDSFFSLGGNSLLAGRLAARLSSALRVQVSIRTVFEHQTVAALATHLGKAGPASVQPPIATLPRVPYRSR